MKVSIFAFAVNDKFPIDIMHRQYSKYMKEEFEFILFNDATNQQMEKNINLIASSNNIKCVRVPQSIHPSNSQDPSRDYALTLNWAFHEYAIQNNCEIIVLIHTDVFPICNVRVSDIIGEHTVASTTEFRILRGEPITHLYPAFTIINVKRFNNVKELDFGLEEGLDTGGRTRTFIKSHPQSVKFLANHQSSYFLGTLEANDPMYNYFKDDISICRAHGLSAGWIAEGFYHYMAGSQWNAGNPTFAEGHKKRMQLFLHYFY
jgi:hypothetical protein